MKLNILPAKDSKDIERIACELSKHKFKQVSDADNFILMKKRRIGNVVIHLGVLFFALFLMWPLIFINLVYFAYSALARSPHVLITTETVDDKGNPLEYSTMDEILEQANAIL